MKYSEGKIGRVFVLKLEDNDMIPGCIEKFAKEKNIKTAEVLLLGGIKEGKVVVGPEAPVKMPPQKMVCTVDEVHEIAAVGLIAPDMNDDPVLHMHGALGRAGNTIMGCFREGLKTWLTGEVIINEIVGINLKRAPDKDSGFVLLDVPDFN
jgi:predicted DNA-binding protein with PD1-like motif